MKRFSVLILLVAIVLVLGCTEKKPKPTQRPTSMTETLMKVQNQLQAVQKLQESKMDHAMRKVENAHAPPKLGVFSITSGSEAKLKLFSIQKNQFVILNKSTPISGFRLPAGKYQAELTQSSDGAKKEFQIEIKSGQKKSIHKEF